MGNPIGVGILAYYGLKDVQRAVRAVQSRTATPYQLMVMDNSENDEVGEWLRHHAADVGYMRSPYNSGCARGRNRIAEYFARRGVTHFVAMDEDVEVLQGKDGPDWLAAMRAVFEAHPDTGIASWYVAIQQMAARTPDYQPDDTGKVAEVPGMCCMYSMACVEATGGWNPAYLMYRFDTSFCLRAAQVGYLTRVVWPDPSLVAHRHPHSGVQRYPWIRREQARSRGIFQQEVEQRGLELPKGMGA